MRGVLCNAFDGITALTIGEAEEPRPRARLVTLLTPGLDLLVRPLGPIRYGRITLHRSVAYGLAPD